MKIFAVKVPEDSYGHTTKRYDAMSGAWPPGDYFKHWIHYFRHGKDVVGSIQLPDPSRGRVYITYDGEENKPDTYWSVLCIVDGLQIKDPVFGTVHSLFKEQEINDTGRYCLLISP